MQCHPPINRPQHADDPTQKINEAQNEEKTGRVRVDTGPCRGCIHNLRKRVPTGRTGPTLVPVYAA